MADTETTVVSEETTDTITIAEATNVREVTSALGKLLEAIEGRGIPVDNFKLQNDKVIIPTTIDQIIEKDPAYDGLGIVTVTGDPDLVPGNIREGVSIFGVNGTCTEPVLQQKTAFPSEESQIIEPDNGYNGLSFVVVEGDSNLIPANIKEGEVIFGVTGTCVNGLVLDTLTHQATADQMLEGHQCYNADGDIITGNIKVAHGGFFRSNENVDVNFNTFESSPATISMSTIVEDTVCIKKTSNGLISLSTPAYNFGTASPDAVAKGRTFTSEYGMQITGTAGTSIISHDTYSETLNIWTSNEV